LSWVQKMHVFKYIVLDTRITPINSNVATISRPRILRLLFQTILILSKLHLPQRVLICSIVQLFCSLTTALPPKFAPRMVPYLTKLSLV
jgi:hypothetical protein